MTTEEVKAWYKNRVEEKKANDIGASISVIVSQPVLDTNKIVSTNIPTLKKFIYRPETLKEYIGQNNAKNLIALNIKKIEAIKPVHFLISGAKGHGKTTLAYIIKHMLSAKIIERIAKQITSNDDIINIINIINQSTEKNVILFIDEIHSLDKNLCEIFYPIIEDFKIAGKNIKPFVLIGATTEKNILLHNNAPLVDRFHVQVDLERYSEADISEILTQYKAQLYPGYDISTSFIQEVAANSKRTPRIAISLLEDGLIERDISYILKCHRIVFAGLTEIDVSILRILSENNKPFGAKALSQMVGISERDYMEANESYLIEQEYIMRTSRGRTITAKGKEIYSQILQRSNHATA